MGTSSAATVGAVVSTTVMTTGSGSESSSPSLTTRVTTYVPYRNAHSIVEHVGRRHHSSPYPVRAGPVLVRRNIGMPPSDLLTAGPAPAYLHPVPRHLGSGNRRNVGCVDNPHSLMLESASTSVAGVLSHRHLYNRLGDFIGRRRLSVAERPIPGLRPGRLGLLLRPPLENGAAWRFPARLSSASCLCNSSLAAVNCATCPCNCVTSPISSSRSEGGKSLASHIAKV